MVFACGISSHSVTMFHLMNHAFFKALLFLSAGAIIHAMHDEQDMRRMGGLNRLLPFTYTMTLIGSFALIGFPFLTGYYSKDFILELACSGFSFTGNFAFWLGTISVSFTTFYSYRLVFLTFINKPNGYKQVLVNAHEPKACMSIPLILLAFGSLFVGYFTKDMIIGLGSPFWGQALYISTQHTTFLQAEYLPYHIKLIPFFFSHIGIFFAYHTTFFLSNSNNPSLNLPFSVQKHISLYLFQTTTPVIKVYTFFNQKWHFDDFYNRFLVQKFIDFGYHTSFKLFDAGWIAFLGPYGIANTISKLSSSFSKLQSGYVYHYAFIFVISITFFISAVSPSVFIQHSFLQHSPLYFLFFISFFFISSINKR